MFDAFYSDPHFGHRKLADLRGFSSVTDHDEALVTRYNATVGPGDLVLWLGDVCFYGADKAARIAGVLRRLNGRKVLVQGNHDWGHAPAWWGRAGFTLAVRGDVRFDLGGIPAVASHFPYAGARHANGPDVRHLEHRPDRRPGEVLLHGHVHTDRRRVENQIHVGVDAWDLRPATRDEVLALAREVHPCT
jgi:calcineurin-like phosphoesterase family protein